MKILAFAGSNSRRSINKELVSWVASQFVDASTVHLDLNDFEMPLFGIDQEKTAGIPNPAFVFSAEIEKADLLLISLAEHNGAYSVAFKNIFDWVSRIPGRSVFQNKPIFLMATSPGKRGGSSVLSMAENRFPYNGGEIWDTFLLPSFGKNFEDGKGIVHEHLRKAIEEKIAGIQEKIEQQL